MSNQTDIYLQKLQLFNLDEEESSVYIYLLKNSFTTALQISRDLKIGRTKVYRILDKLQQSHLAEDKLGERGLEFGATNPHTLKQLAQERQKQAQSLINTSEQLAQELEKLIPNNIQKSKVLYYEGIEGMKQVTYNTTHAKGLLRVYEVEHMSSFLDEKFAEDIRRRYVENKIVTYDLTNKKTMKDFTSVHEYVKSFSKLRYIDPKDLKIQFEVLIYNDVYVTYTYTNEEIFCVEIYNPQLAAMQKQLYDVMWKQAVPMKYTSLRGEAHVNS